MAEITATNISTSSINENVTASPQENLNDNKLGDFLQSSSVEILSENNQKENAQTSGETSNMNISHLIEEEDTSSSDLKWESMSVTSMQSGMTQFDTIEDVSYAIGKHWQIRSSYHGYYL